MSPTQRTPAVQRLDRVLHVVSASISRVCVVIITVMLIAMLVAVMVQIVARYGTSSIVGGPEEIARLSMVGMVFLALPVLAHQSENIRLDVAQELLKSPRAREWLTRAALALELVFFAVLTYIAIDFIDKLAASTQMSPALGLRLVWSRLPVLVGPALATIVCACVLARHLIGTDKRTVHTPDIPTALA